MMKYCDSIYTTKRRQTREVLVGNVGVGGINPIRIQSMTTSNTRDVEATIGQIIRLADVGCEIARVTVQGIKEADACEQIKNGLLQKGYTIPIVADIHFYPPAALRVVEFADKVRINPGNFVDKRASFKTIEYDDTSYALEIEKIEEKFTPLIQKCKLLKRSMRIGTNHGSLSDRIMNRYGDTPGGMLESALEFARICRKNDYHDFMFSMKSSNPQVMIHAYRLLAAEMYRLDWDYPMHLGVTEAGEGEDGRIKSAMGIGTLLLDGLGDTIRVSLTEDAWNEIDPCKRLLNLTTDYQNYAGKAFVEHYRDFQKIERRIVNLSKNLSLHRDGTVIISVKEEDFTNPNFVKMIGCEKTLNGFKPTTSTSDNIFLQNKPENATLKLIEDLKQIGIGILSNQQFSEAVTIRNLSKPSDNDKNLLNLNRFTISFPLHSPQQVMLVRDNDNWNLIEELKPELILFKPSDNHLHKTRHFFDWLREKKLTIPVILNFSYDCQIDDLIIFAAAELGSLLCDGLGEGIWIEGDYEPGFLRQLSFNILQAARMRTSKTDFISCPSCGRTLFDLQEVTKRIRERTVHLPGVKIAIMGCIVNGPGEMADADFGYVGSRPGMIDLYLGKICVEKNIPFDQADDRLVELIKANGRWKDPETNLALINN